ncbi:unnamed protein product [Cochlearia groenlandica]
MIFPKKKVTFSTLIGLLQGVFGFTRTFLLKEGNQEKELTHQGIFHAVVPQPAEKANLEQPGQEPQLQPVLGGAGQGAAYGEVDKDYMYQSTEGATGFRLKHSCPRMREKLLCNKILERVKREKMASNILSIITVIESLEKSSMENKAIVKQGYSSIDDKRFSRPNSDTL